MRFIIALRTADCFLVHIAFESLHRVYRPIPIQHCAYNFCISFAVVCFGYLFCIGLLVSGIFAVVDLFCYLRDPLFWRLSTGVCALPKDVFAFQLVQS